MIIGVPKEIKNNENRVSMTPAGVYELTKRGHTVLVEVLAGEGSSFEDSEYLKAGAKLIEKAEDVWSGSDLVVKVKEPISSEYQHLRKGLTLFTYLHLAPNRPLSEALINSKTTGIAYETVLSNKGTLPLLEPMSEVAGRMSVQVGAYMLQKYNGGRGMLLGGVPGVLPAEVVIAGGGTVGLNAARMASGLGARVTVLEINYDKMVYIDEISGGKINTLYSNEFNMTESLEKADLFISGVLIPGARAPKIVTENMVKKMKKGAVIVDVAIDQGGSVETIDRVTTHDNPCFEKHGVIHYSVANMPGAVPRTSTMALAGATLPYVLKLANKGVEASLKEDSGFMAGLNTFNGSYAYKAVADAMNAEFVNPKDLF